MCNKLLPAVRRYAPRFFIHTKNERVPGGNICPPYLCDPALVGIVAADRSETVNISQWLNFTHVRKTLYGRCHVRLLTYDVICYECSVEIGRLRDLLHLGGVSCFSADVTVLEAG